MGRVSPADMSLPGSEVRAWCWGALCYDAFLLLTAGVLGNRGECEGQGELITRPSTLTHSLPQPRHSYPPPRTDLSSSSIGAPGANASRRDAGPHTSHMPHHMGHHMGHHGHAGLDAHEPAVSLPPSVADSKTPSEFHSDAESRRDRREQMGMVITLSDT